jgi:hypothetical protein
MELNEQGYGTSADELDGLLEAKIAQPNTPRREERAKKNDKTAWKHASNNCG